jgi:predicted nucleic acid-binding protein
MILVDTSAWVAFFRDRGRLAERVAVAVSDGDAVLCGPVLTELVRGLRSSERKRVLPLLEALDILSPPPDLWLAAGELGYVLARKGKTAKSLDLLIACYAIHHGATVLTDDADFSAMAESGVPIAVDRGR